MAAQLGAFGAVVKRRFDVPAEHAWVVDSETCNRPGVAVPHACCGNKSKEDKWGKGTKRKVGKINVISMPLLPTHKNNGG